MITRHFRNTLAYIHAKKTVENPGQWDEVDVVGAFLKMGITR
jgi:vacuolar protein sorting-associated protein 35